jgi:hypothetical protein
MTFDRRCCYCRMQARDEHHNPSEYDDKQITNNICMESSHQQNVMNGSVIQVNHHSNPASEHQQEETGDERMSHQNLQQYPMKLYGFLFAFMCMIMCQMVWFILLMIPKHNNQNDNRNYYDTARSNYESNGTTDDTWNHTNGFDLFGHMSAENNTT